MNDSLLTWDDFGDEAEPGVEYVWRHVELRMLVPRHDHFDQRKALVVNTMSSGWDGVPVQCQTCDNVAIDLAGFPWGLQRYGQPDRMIYCPHCDGGEDEG